MRAERFVLSSCYILLFLSFFGIHLPLFVASTSLANRATLTHVFQKPSGQNDGNHLAEWPVPGPLPIFNAPLIYGSRHKREYHPNEINSCVLQKNLL